MRIKVVVALILASALPVQAQTNMFADALDNFATSRFWQYEEIAITWNMKGILQADINEGLNALVEGNASVAEYNFSNALKIDSTLWQVYYYRGVTRKLLRKFPAAVQDFKNAVRLHSDFYEGYVELGKIYHIAGNDKESERAIRKAIQINKSKPVAYYVRGDIDLSQEEPKNASKNYEECLAVDSMFHDARIKLALLDISDKKKVSVAVERLNKVLEYDSLQKNALLFRAILIATHYKRQSIKDLSNLIKVSPNNLMAYFFRGLVFTDLQDYDRAFSDFRKVINAASATNQTYSGQRTWLDKMADMQNAGRYTVSRIYGLREDDAAKIRKAYCYILIGAYDWSIHVLNTTSQPNFEPLCIYLRAVSYEHKGVHQSAYEEYALALQYDKDIADAYKKRGIYLQKRLQWERSLKDLNEALRLSPDVFVIYKFRGTSNLNLKRFKEALSDYSTYLAYDSTNKEVLGLRGMAYLQNKERLRAYMDFARSDKSHMFNFNDVSHLIDSVLITGDTTLALKALRPMTEKYAEFTEGFARKFKVQLKRGDWSDIERDISYAIVKRRMDAPKSDHAYLLTVQAMNLVRQKRENDALTAFFEAISLDKTSDLAYLERGKLYLEMGKSSKAESDLRQASSLGNKQAKQLLASKMK
jgi:tetratricopeptide (TPR) repeat protein